MKDCDHETTMTAHWLQSGIGPRDAVAKLQPACDGAPLSEEVMRELEDKWRDERNAAHLVYGILGGPWNRLAGFDLKDVVSPADHTDIVRDLAGITGNQFAVDDVVQTDEPDGDVNLLVVQRGKSHSFGVEGRGR